MKHLATMMILAIFGLTLVIFGGLANAPAQAGDSGQIPELLSKSPSSDHDLLFEGKYDDEEEDDDDEDD